MAASKACVNRLQKEYRSLLKDPLPGVVAHPFPSNLLEWHFVLEGGKGTEYEGGVYHGIMQFPPAYPYRPPSLQMLTPSGRFAVSQKICLSNTDYHAETWNPAWGAGTILVGLLSFMSETAHTTGSISSSRAEKRRLAAASLEYNMRSARFRRLFPDYCEEHAQRLASQAPTGAAAGARAAVGAPVRVAAAPGVPALQGKADVGWAAMLTSVGIGVVLLGLLMVPLMS